MAKVDILLIETVGNCNLACTMCPTVNYDEGKFLMPKPVFERILEFVAQNPINHFDMTGWGEPLLDKKLHQKIAAIRELRPKATITFTTNGTLFSDKRIGEIVESGVNHVNVSFDAGTKDTYEMIRVNSEFDSTVENLRNLQAAREKSGRNLWLSGTFVVMNDNIHELTAFVELFLGIGFNQVIFKPLDVFSTRENLRQHVARHKILPRVAALAKEFEGKIRIDHFDLEDNHPADDCLALARERAVFINCNGDVAPCCNLGHHVPIIKKRFLLSSKKGNNFFAFGNLRDTGLEEVLADPVYARFGDAFRSGKLPDVCDGCALAGKELQKRKVIIRHDGVRSAEPVKVAFN